MHEKAVWTASLRAPRALAPLFEAALAGAQSLDVAFEADGGQRLRAIWEGEAPRAEVEAAVAVAAAAASVAPPRVVWEALRDRDWTAESLAALAPARGGRFRLRGSHHAPRPGPWDLCIDAGAAFGTGHHETTRGCLRALCALARRRRFARPLDLGCGSGVLALAMARLWRRPVTAVDNDPAAVAATRGNARRNRLAPLVSCRRGEGFAGLPRGRRYDLVAANLLARPLVALAPALGVRLAPGGVAVLSGVLETQAAVVLAACRRSGLVPRRRWEEGGWPTLCVFKPRAAEGRWLGDLDSNQDCSGQSRKFYR